MVVEKDAGTTQGTAKKCAADEVIRAVCKNRQSCCVSQLAVFVKEKLSLLPHSRMVGEEKDMDRIVSSSIYFGLLGINNKNKED